MKPKYEKIVLPPDYKEKTPPALIALREQMEERVHQINDQIIDAMKKNPNMTPERFGSVDWHTRARRAQDIYRRDINRITLHLLSITAEPVMYKNANANAATEILNNKINAAFKQVSRRRLTETLYKGILEEAKEEAKIQ